MFGFVSRYKYHHDLTKQEDGFERVMARKTHEFDMYVEKIKKDHELEIREKEFELTHIKDEEVLRLKKENRTLEQENAVLKKENSMLDKLIDVNADIINVKELVERLIEKLPNIDIKSLTVQSKK